MLIRRREEASATAIAIKRRREIGRSDKMKWLYRENLKGKEIWQSQGEAITNECECLKKCYLSVLNFCF